MEYNPKYWDQFYTNISAENLKKLNVHSSFAELVQQYYPDKKIVIDFGCGQGGSVEPGQI